MKSITRKIVILMSAVLLSACSTVPQFSQRGNPDTYARGQAMKQGKVMQGVVLQARDITLKSGGAPIATGAGLGAGLGALLGRNSKNQKWIALATGGAGFLAGASAGTTTAQEIVVVLGDGTSRVIVQEPGSVQARKGDKVLVLVNGPESRIVGLQ